MTNESVSHGILVDPWLFTEEWFEIAARDLGIRESTIQEFEYGVLLAVLENFDVGRGCCILDFDLKWGKFATTVAYLTGRTCGFPMGMGRQVRARRMQKNILALAPDLARLNLLSCKVKWLPYHVGPCGVCR